MKGTSGKLSRGGGAPGGGRDGGWGGGRGRKPAGLLAPGRGGALGRQGGGEGRGGGALQRQPGPRSRGGQAPHGVAVRRGGPGAQGGGAVGARGGVVRGSRGGVRRRARPAPRGVHGRGRRVGAPGEAPLPLALQPAAGGRKVRVFWPAMGKWYIGSIKDYDADKGEHLVAYKDGERQSLQLRNEPIQWLPVEGGDGKDGGKTPGSSGKVGGGGEQQQQQQQQRRERAEQGGRAHSDSKDSEGDAVDPAVFSGRVPKGGRGSRAGGAASASESEDDADGASPPSGGPKKRKAAGREGGGPKRAKGEPGSSSEGGGVPTTEGPRTPENLEAGETDEEMPPPASREPGARPGVSGQVGSMEPEAGRALVGRRVSVWDTADHRYRKGSVLGFDQEARMAFVRFEDGEREWTDLGKARMKLLGEDSPGGRGQSGSPPGGAATKTGSSGRRSPRRAAGAIDAECSEFGTALGVKVGSRVGLGAVAGESGAAELGHVIAFRPQERLTHILCDDGGDKWVELQGTQWFVSQEAALPRPW